MLGALAAIPDWVGLAHTFGFGAARLAPRVQFLDRALPAAGAASIVLILASLIWRSRRRLRASLGGLRRSADAWIRRRVTGALAWYARVLRWQLNRIPDTDMDAVMPRQSGPTVRGAGWVPENAVSALSDAACEVLHRALMQYDQWEIPLIYIEPQQLPSLSTTLTVLRQMDTLVRASEELYAAGLLRSWDKAPDEAQVWVLLPDQLWNKGLATQFVYALQDQLCMRGVWDW